MKDYNRKRDLVCQKVRQSIMYFNKRFSMNVPVDAEIGFNRRLTKQLGLCEFGENVHGRYARIEFNERAMNINFDEFMSDVVLHETAHYITAHTASRSDVMKKHRSETFKCVCNFFGISGRKSDARNYPGLFESWVYECDCKEGDKIHYLQKIRHNRVQRGEQNYRCVKCESMIRDTGIKIGGAKIC